MDPYLALLSWNGQTTEFDTQIELISSGVGYYGSGTAALVDGNTALSTTGEFHGIIRLPGTFTSITFTDLADEFWHGVTVGIGGTAGDPGPGPGPGPGPDPVETPEPAALGLLGLGLVGTAGLRRRKNR